MRSVVRCNDWYGLLPVRSRHHVPQRRLGFNELNEEEADMDATTVAVDLAKDVFEVATANSAGRILERKRLTRRQFEAFVDGCRPAQRS